jgi:hypothetical protein
VVTCCSYQKSWWLCIDIPANMVSFFFKKIPEQRILIPHSTWINAKHIPILFVFIPDIGSASGTFLSKNGGWLIYFVFDHICIYDVWLFGQPISYGFLLFIYDIPSGKLT